MRRYAVARVVAAWAALTALAAAGMHCWTRIDAAPEPPEDAARWAVQALRVGASGEPVPEPPASARSYRAPGPVHAIAWQRGRPVAKHIGTPALVEAIEDAARRFADDETLDAHRASIASSGDPDRVRFTVEVPLGDGPVLQGIPYVSSLGLVPMREGLIASLGGETATLTPEELRAEGAYDRGVPTPVPDLSFGVDLDGLVDRLARELGVSAARLRSEGTVRRFRATTLAESAYPDGEAEVTERALRRAAIEGARFLLRHQQTNGRYTYLYDGNRGRQVRAGYSLPRHAGTTWFLAQVARYDDMPEARRGAIDALDWLGDRFVRECGGPELWCVGVGRRVEAGSSALTAVAAAEVLEGGDHPAVRKLLERVSAFLRSLQRKDGQLMHEYDVKEQQPIDVQHMYYSGEAALALLKAHAVLGDERDLEAARRLMRHLTGKGWSFLGSRYYYGEEHWTCIAAGEAAGRLDTTQALDFCQRWAQFNRRIQYGPGETPWDVRGAYGVGPVLLPRLTPVGSRTEAFISTYQLARKSGQRSEAVRRQVERALGMLLRWRWSPGPVHAMADPDAARGGIPTTPADLRVRNDFVQHAGSAMIRWADVLRQEGE